jgi:aminoglycoside phosphotransferase family enzyme
MDYRTLTAREKGCHEELRLNRRLAPFVYLDVVALSEQNGRLVLGAGQIVQDWLVKMKRLPPSRMLDHALRLGDVRDRNLDEVALALARFFDAAAATPMEGDRYVERIAANVRSDLEALQIHNHRFPQDLVTEVMELQGYFLRAAHTLLAGRGARLVEGHGDLRAEHVYLGPPVAVIDCLEFDPELRVLDPFEEVALLVLEIEQLGYPDIAGQLRRRCCALICHASPSSVLHFYMSRRATVRAKLAAWHLDEPQFPDPRPWIARVESSLTAAARYADQALDALTAPDAKLSRPRANVQEGPS